MFSATFANDPSVTCSHSIVNADPHPRNDYVRHFRETHEKRVRRSQSQSPPQRCFFLNRFLCQGKSVSLYPLITRFPTMTKPNAHSENDLAQQINSNTLTSILQRALPQEERLAQVLRTLEVL